jgi:glycosyltransferase involved in cell wall biosynthesis
MWPSNLPVNQAQPPVSIVTPTYNRKRFLPSLIECIKEQTYPLERIEWLVYDDGNEPVWDILKPYEKELNIRYFRSETKLTIGAKRNKLNDEARGKIIVTMDDDDYYFPNRVKSAVMGILAHKVQIAGSSKNILYFTDDKSIWQVLPYGPNHATFGTMAYTKEYTKSHRCDETVAFAEEVQFTNRYSEPLFQLNPENLMVVMCHSENTFNKSKLRTDGNPNFKKTTMVLKALIKNSTLRAFYMSA